MAVLGIVLNAVDLHRFKKFSMVCYIGMGWAIVMAFRPLLSVFEPAGLWLLIGGGILYTIGAVLYGVGKKVRYMHSVWHLFVLGGSILHFFSVLLYVLPVA